MAQENNTLSRQEAATEESQVSAYEVQRQHNMWAGLYDEATQGYLRLEGLAYRSSGEGSVAFGYPKEKPRVILSKLDPSALHPRGMSVLYFPESRLGEGDHFGKAIRVSLLQNGELPLTFTYEVLLRKNGDLVKGDLLEEDITDMKLIQPDDVENVESLFNRIQASRKRALELRRKSLENERADKGWLGKIAAKFSKAKG